MIRAGAGADVHLEPRVGVLFEGPPPLVKRQGLAAVSVEVREGTLELLLVIFVLVVTLLCLTVHGKVLALAHPAVLQQGALR